MEGVILERRQKVANIIREARELHGLTQEQLADEVGFTRNTIVRIENLTFSPNADQLYVICKVLNIELKLNDNVI